MIGLKKNIKVIALFSGIATGIILLNACHSEKKIEAVEKHQARVQQEGAGMIYVDKIQCGAVIKSTDSAGSNTSFRCYVVGFIDSLSAAKAADKKDIETGKYYQYDMQKDWVAMSNGDSLRPVFFQPRQRLESHRYEGILVFETPKDNEPDTLIYNDSYSAWGVQQIIINSNKK